MGTFGRSITLAKASWSVLLADKELALFMVLSAVCTVLAFVIFMVPAAVARGLIDSIEDTRGLDPVWIALLVGFYLVTSFITIFFNTALIGAALERMRGGNPNLSTGFAIATRNLPSIAVYALISATVGLILYAIEEKFELVGQIARSILGFAWSLVTFLVIPVMVAEGVNPFAAIPRSGSLLRRTWGEQLIGNAGMGMVQFALAVPAAIVFAMALTTGDLAKIIAIGVIALMWILALAVVFSALAQITTGDLAKIIAIGVIALMWILALAVVFSALAQIYRAALYLYAETGRAPAGFEPWMMRDAFRQKQR